MKQTGDEIKTIVGLRTQALSGEASVAYGVAFDRMNYESGIFFMHAGDVANTPTNVLLTFGLQECATQTGTYAAVTLTDYTTTISGELAAIPGSSLEINMDFRARMRWLKPTMKTNFSNGSSPTVGGGIVVVLGEAKIEPAV